MSSKDLKAIDALDFSLFVGGPLYRFYLRSSLATPPLNRMLRRIVVLPLAAWLPALLLSLFSGHATNGPLPFLFDVETHVRFLVALPLFIAAESMAHMQLRPLINVLIKREIILKEDQNRFLGIVRLILRLRDSNIIEVLILLFVWTVGNWFWTSHTLPSITTWYTSTQEGQVHYTLPGYWYIFFGIPLFQFILFRWYFRIFLWHVFLWKISRLQLNLVPTHPDRSGGLGFIGRKASYSFLLFFLAHTVLFSGIIGNAIWHLGVPLSSYRTSALGLIILLLLVVISPLFFFSHQLMKAKREGLMKLNDFSMRYARDFERKWLQDKTKTEESALGSADIQSLSDLSNSFTAVNQMRLIPIEKKNVLSIALVLLFPFAPLLLTKIPLETIFNRLVQILL